MGIPGKDLERIFELFTQVDQTLERSHGGLGIGLTLVKNLVELHGGTVRAYSDGINQGSQFVVTLPRMNLNQSHEANDPGQPGANCSRPKESHRILVVDDTQASGRMLSLLLKSLGQQTELCFDGQSALAVVDPFQPELIFLDIAMPGMNGYEVARQLKNDPATSHIVLVAMTGYGQESDRLRAFAAGFNHHMVKPANMEALSRVIVDLETPKPSE